MVMRMARVDGDANFNSPVAACLETVAHTSV